MTVVTDRGHYKSITFLGGMQYVYFQLDIRQTAFRGGAPFACTYPILDEHYKKHLFMCSGRKIPRTGGIILCNCADMVEAKAIMEKDPFYKEGIAQYDIIEFVPSKSSEAFQVAMSEQTK